MKKLTKTLIVLSILFSIPAFASDAYVRTPHQEGQGILRPIGDSCFLYTPAHVVTRAQGVLIETRLRKKLQGELINSYPQDLALVKLKDSSACEESSWNGGGERVDAILDVISSGRLNYKHQQGRLEVFDLEITNKAVDTTFNIKLKDSKKFRKGMSGSIITVGDYPIGMLLSVEGDIGTVLRMDTIADLSRRVILRYATDLERIEMGDTKVRSESNIATEPQNPVGIKNAPPPKQTYENRDQVFNGRISKGETTDHKILARGNTAYRIIGQPQRDSVDIQLEFLDDAGNSLFSKTHRTSNKLDWGVGVTSPGEYTLRVIGRDYAGQYSLDVKTIATPEELTSPSNIIGTNDSVLGFISNGTFADYKILARGNTAYRIIGQPQRDSVDIRLEFLDDAGNSLFSKTHRTSNKLDWGVGVTSPGEYTLRVIGRDYAGQYSLDVKTIATPEELTSPSNIIGTNDSVLGFISNGTFADYKILARGNTTYRIIGQPQRDSVDIRLEFLDDEGNSLFSETHRTSNKLDWGVGATSPGEYTLRVIGRDYAGQYNLEFVESSH